VEGREGQDMRTYRPPGDVLVELSETKRKLADADSRRTIRSK